MNTVRANITSSRYAETNSIFQYDTGRKLEIYGYNLPKSVEVQFSTDKEKGKTITRVGNTNNGVTSTIIPNQLLNDSEKTSNFYIFAFLYNVDNEGGRTEYVIKIPVVARPKPENPSEEPLPEPNIFHETVVAVNASAERAEKALGDVEEIRDNLNLDLSEKITRPQTAEVGQVLAVKEIDESGKPTVFEAEDVKAHASGVNDVIIDGKTITIDGIATIPAHKDRQTRNDFGTVVMGVDGDISIYRNSTGEIGYRYLPLNSIDAAVKCAMCDGKGAAWTAEEQAAARERMGIDEYEDVLDVTLEEDSLFSADFEHEYKQLYIYIDQSGVTEKIQAAIYMYPYSYVNGEGKKINTFGSYFPSTSKAYPNVASVWKSYGKVTTRIASVTNDQKNTTGNQTACLKVWDTSMINTKGIGDPFKGIYQSSTIFKAGTRIVVKGMRV